MSTEDGERTGDRHLMAKLPTMVSGRAITDGRDEWGATKHTTMTNGTSRNRHNEGTSTGPGSMGIRHERTSAPSAHSAVNPSLFVDRTGEPPQAGTPAYSVHSVLSVVNDPRVAAPQRSPEATYGRTK